MTLLKGNDYKDINVALLSLEADIKNKITNFDTSVIDRQLAEINSRIDKINAGGNNSSAEINDIRYEIENINSKLNGNSVRIENIEQKLSDIFSAENKVTDFNATTDSGIYYWATDAANRPSDYGVLLVNKHDGGSTTSLWINQIAYGTNSKIYFRQNINSAGWTEWKAVAFDGEITAKKVANALTVNGKTYDGSSAVDAGVQLVANGGTGVTTQADINKAFISNLGVGNDDVTDGTEFVSSWASDNGFAETADGALNKPYKRQFIKVWNYIKGKISSVLGLTKDTYGGTAAAILDYVKGTPIKVRWGGSGIDSAEWYPAFNADGSALEPINRTNIHAGTADCARNMYYQNLDLSALDKTKFYPLVSLPSFAFAEVAICSENGPGSMDYNQNRIHFDMSTHGWTDLPPTLNIREYACFDNNEVTIGCIGRGVHSGAWAIWLRGGLHYVCFSRDCNLSLKTSDYTSGDEVYTVGTNYYGGSNTNVSIWFTPQSTITEGAYSSRQITATEIKATGNFYGNLSGKADTAGTADFTTGVKYTGESYGCISAHQTSGSFNNSSADWASYIICNHQDGTTYYHQMLRLPFFSDTIQLQRRVNGELQGWKNVAVMENENTWSGTQTFNTAKASSKMVIPIGAPSNLEDGCIWIS